MGNGQHIDEMLTIRQVARLLHVHPNTLRRWSNEGKLKAYRITSRGDRRFRRQDVARFLAEMNEARTAVGSAR
jgi:excisionase family DNA binding protein